MKAINAMAIELTERSPLGSFQFRCTKYTSIVLLAQATWSARQSQREQSDAETSTEQDSLAGDFCAQQQGDDDCRINHQNKAGPDFDDCGKGEGPRESLTVRFFPLGLPGNCSVAALAFGSVREVNDSVARRRRCLSGCFSR